MEFFISDLEREPVEFDQELASGAIDFGDLAEQEGMLASSGRAEVIHEHRGPKEVVPDMRIRGRFSGRFRVPCARCVEPVESLECAGIIIMRSLICSLAVNSSWCVR